MAVIKLGAGIAGLTGATGNTVYAVTENGVVVRERPTRRGQSTEAQARMERAMRRANSLWRNLNDDQAEAWRAYARKLSARSPRTGLLQAPKAVNVFVGLTVKYLQVHDGFEAPLHPPVGEFLGDVVQVTARGEGSEIVFVADRPNQPGVLTELLAQKLRGRHNAPRPRSYVSQGFFAFAPGSLEFRIQALLGHYATGFRFVEASSGRATALVASDRVFVPEWP